MSQCTPLFFNVYNLRNAGACIHTHSQNAVMITLLYETVFEISHQEMIKGIRRGTSQINYRYDEKLTVPIIENTCREEDLEEHMAKVSYFFGFFNLFFLFFPTFFLLMLIAIGL